LKKVQHKNVIGLHDVIESVQSLYLVMEFASGKNL